jgi:hypothetical protein
MYMAGQFVGDIQRRNKLHLVVRVKDPLGAGLPGVALQFFARESRFDSRHLPNGDVRTTTSYTTPFSIVRLDRPHRPGAKPASFAHPAPPQCLHDQLHWGLAVCEVHQVRPLKSFS